jgi:hypothetical protein
MSLDGQMIAVVGCLHFGLHLQSACTVERTGLRRLRPIEEQEHGRALQHLGGSPAQLTPSAV